MNTSNKMYSDEVNAQIIVALLKAHGIRQVVASPGATNIPIVGSIQNDPFFFVLSAVDERSAAYIACGLAYETGEPVVISCTGATASRNYLPALTEAYYRKLPIIAITSQPSLIETGHLLPQCIDRSQKPKDSVRLSVSLPKVKDSDDFWECEIKVNKAITECIRAGGGPVHINLATSYLGTFTTKKLPQVRAIRRYFQGNEAPRIEPSSKIVIFVGSHKPFSNKETEAIDSFIDSYNAVVLCDHTSNFTGKGKILASLACFQALFSKPEIASLKPDLIIHIGEVSGDYPILDFLAGALCPTWRVSEDGEIRDKFKTLINVFEMPEKTFFEKYSKDDNYHTQSYLQAWKAYDKKVRAIPCQLPFSNTWIAQDLAAKLPINSTLHLGILNSLRNWNLFEIDNSISASANVGGFGIDGCVSTLIGSAIATPAKLHFGIIGDLAFFYDLNSIGNRHVPKNLRLLLINNGGCGEFELSSHCGSQFGKQTGDYISADGHFGKKSATLVRDMASSLGFIYLSATTKDEYNESIQSFISGSGKQPIIFECFTEFSLESKALESMAALDQTNNVNISHNSAKRLTLKRRTKALLKLSLVRIINASPSRLKVLIKESITP